MIEPHHVGLPATAQRRVAGLRREEVAEIVGVSTDYYVRLEQGRARHPSDDVLDALADALQLGAAERAHLHNLTQPGRRNANRKRGHPPGPALRGSLRAAVTSIHQSPALIMNDRTDVLAWNALAAQLIADFPNLPAAQRNMAWQIFLDPGARDIHPDWDEAARTTVGILRMAAGRRPRDGALTRLIGALTAGSETFGQLWSTQHVHQKTHGPKRFHHRTVGEISVHYETFDIPKSADGDMLVIYTATGTDQHRLDQLAAQTRLTPPRPTECTADPHPRRSRPIIVTEPS
jgi:transcriptional regulator with XRE-family HTH domain